MCEKSDLIEQHRNRLRIAVIHCQLQTLTTERGRTGDIPLLTSDKRQEKEGIGCCPIESGATLLRERFFRELRCARVITLFECDLSENIADTTGERSCAGIDIPETLQNGEGLVTVDPDLCHVVDNRRIEGKADVDVGGVDARLRITDYHVGVLVLP
jgi:hypothetical protein